MSQNEAKSRGANVKKSYLVKNEKFRIKSQEARARNQEPGRLGWLNSSASLMAGNQEIIDDFYGIGISFGAGACYYLVPGI